VSRTDSYVVVQERFTKDAWYRKIGDGDWKRMDCKPPYLIIEPIAEFEVRQYESLVSPRQAELLRLSE